jgi:uncharacterized integral membrane protein
MSQSLQRNNDGALAGRQIIAAIIVVAALLFIFQNTYTGDFHFLWFDFKAPVWFWMLVVFCGCIATGLSPRGPMG